MHTYLVFFLLLTCMQQLMLFFRQTPLALLQDAKQFSTVLHPNQIFPSSAIMKDPDVPLSISFIVSYAYPCFQVNEKHRFEKSTCRQLGGSSE